MRLRHLILTSLFSLATLSGGAFAITVSLDESRQIAQAALSQGKPEITLQIAASLLQANPKDSHALLLVSAANHSLKQPLHGRRAAALAYRYSDNKAQRLQAAQLAAQNALAEERPTLTQIWLRRAALQAETDAETEAISRAYGRVRTINPWSFHADLSIRPTSNINNGSDTSLQIIDGVPVVGQLSSDAQALSGTLGTVTLRASYRLRADERSRTSVAGRLQVRRVELSSETEAVAPNVSSRTFAYTYADLSLNHTFAIGESKGNFVRLGATIAALWASDDIDYTLLRLDAERIWRPKDGQRLSFGGSVTGYNRDGSLQDSVSYGIRGGYSRTLKRGDNLGLTIAYEKSVSDLANRELDSVNMRLSYGFAKSWGPAKATASLTISHADFDEYSVGPIVVPGGRQDTGAYADLSLFFPDFDYAGFAPKVTFRAGRKSSNVSRFDTRELSIQVGIQSKF